MMNNFNFEAKKNSLEMKQWRSQKTQTESREERRDDAMVRAANALIPKCVYTLIPKCVYTLIPKCVYTLIPKCVYTLIPKCVYDE
jgi:hypothetical protein